MSQPAIPVERGTGTPNLCHPERTAEERTQTSRPTYSWVATCCSLDDIHTLIRADCFKFTSYSKATTIHRFS